MPTRRLRIRPRSDLLLRATGEVVTAQTGTASAALAGSTWGFDPAANGFTNAVNRPFDTKAANNADRGTGSYPNKVGGSEGWDGIEWQYGNLTIVADATGPLSGGNVMRTTYPTSLIAGAAPGTAQSLSLTGATMGSRTWVELYVRTAFKLGPGYYVNSVSNKIFFHRGTQLGGATGRIEPFYALHNNGAGGFKIAINFQGCPTVTNQRGFIFATPGSTGDAIARSQWVRIESYGKLSSAPGVADGLWKTWVNGTLCIDLSDIDYLWTAPQYWDQLHFNGTWGGSGSPAVPFYHDCDGYQIWGK